MPAHPAPRGWRRVRRPGKGLGRLACPGPLAVPPLPPLCHRPESGSPEIDWPDSGSANSVRVGAVAATTVTVAVPFTPPALAVTVNGPPVRRGAVYSPVLVRLPF